MGVLRMELPTPASDLAPLLLPLGNRHFLRIARMHHHRNQSRLPLRRRVPRHVMQAPRRLVERLARFKDLRRLIIDAQLVLTFKHIHKPRPRMPMRKFYRRELGFWPVIK